MPIAAVVADHRAQLDKLEAGTVSRLVEPYQLARESILKTLADLNDRNRGDSFTAKHLRATLAQVDDALNTMESAHHEAITTDIGAAAEMGGVQVVTEVAALEAVLGEATVATQVAAIVPLIPVETVALMAEPATLLLSEFRGGIFTDVARELTQSVIAGEGIPQASRRLADVFPDAQKYELERIARTEIAQAVNTGHEKAVAQVAAEFPALEMKKQWSSHFDGKTSKICQELGKAGGQIREAGQDFEADGWQGPHPPAHPNCRSRVIPYRAAWAAFERDRTKKGAAWAAYRKAIADAQPPCGPGCNHEEDDMSQTLLKRGGQTVERRTSAFEFKMVDEEAGVCEGYAAAFNNIDSYGDTIVKGAFAETLEEWKASGQMIPILWQHDPTQPIGVCDPKDMFEDEIGLKARFQLAKGVQAAEEARTLMKMGALGGLSIGWSANKDGASAPPKGSKAKRLLKNIKLWEFSPVTFPANRGAVITGVKAEGKAADMETVLDLADRSSDLWRRKWRLESALEAACELALKDENLDRTGKLAAINTNLAQFHGAMGTWYSDRLDLQELAEAAGIETRSAHGPDEAKAGRTISAATKTTLTAARTAMGGACEALDVLIAAAEAKPAADDAGTDSKGDGVPEPAAAQHGQGSKSARAGLLERMRGTGVVSRMKAAM